MEHYFEIPVNSEGNEQLLNARLVTFGYDYKFYIVVKGEEFVFEKDKQGDFRITSGPSISAKEIDENLVESIVLALRQLSVQFDK